MLRELGAFFLLFSFLSLVLHMSGMMQLLGAAALIVFAIDLFSPRFASRFRSSQIAGNSQLHEKLTNIRSK